ncbi:MAG: permease prefix domain 1-containing protein, partial [Opitutaceae bacterium]
MRLWNRLALLWRRNRLERAMAEEMQAHLDGLTERNMAAGMSPEEALYAAQRAFGGVEQIKERARDERGWVWLENLGRDVRFSLRSLRRSVGFSAAVIITLALCIGANTTIMSMLYGLILKPLPFHDAGQLVEIYNSYPKAGRPNERVGMPQYFDYKANADLFEGFAMWNAWGFNDEKDGDPVRGIGAEVTADYYTLLGVQPLLGRFFTMDECVPGKDT